MKLISITLISILLFLIPMHDTKLNLLCQQWRQVGIKYFDKDYKPIDRSMSETIIVKKDGTYEKELHATLKFKGKWKFSNDSSKLAFSITEMNGTVTSNLSIENTKPTDSLIRLTIDTLIIGRLAYYGVHKIYGHDDWYYTREK
jgi:hypothetical protein